MRCIFSLADLELRQHESLLASQGLPPMDPSACSQFRAICYRQTSACIGHAVAKASVMRLLGVPRLPLPQLIPSCALARNRPGPADSFLLIPSPTLPPLAPSPLLRPYPFPLPLLRNSSLFLDALSFLLSRAFALS